MIQELLRKEQEQVRSELRGKDGHVLAGSRS